MQHVAKPTMSSGTEEALAHLIAPISLNHFFDEYFEKKTLYVTQRPESYYNDFLTSAALNAFLSRPGLPYPTVQLSQEGAHIAPEQYVNGWSGDHPTIDLDRCFSAFHRGATLAINGAQTLFPSLIHATRSVSQYFKSLVQANVYITPPQSQGFKVHFDGHDVLVLQIEGTKQWRLYESSLVLPNRTETNARGTDHPADLPVRETLTLGPGDLLYLPRGTVHAAEATTTVSIHITLGLVGAVSWGDFLIQAAGEHQPSALLRQTVPFWNSDQFEQQLPAMLDALTQHLTTIPWAATLSHQTDPFLQFCQQSKAQCVTNRLTDFLSVDSLALSSRVGVRAEVLQEINAEGETIVVTLSGRQMTLPGYLAPVLQFILRTPLFAIASLPDELDDESKLLLVKSLVREGLLTVEKP